MVAVLFLTCSAHSACVRLCALINAMSLRLSLQWAYDWAYNEPTIEPTMSLQLSLQWAYNWAHNEPTIEPTIEPTMSLQLSPQLSPQWAYNEPTMSLQLSYWVICRDRCDARRLHDLHCQGRSELLEVVAILNSLAQPVVGLGLLEKDREKQNEGTKQCGKREMSGSAWKTGRNVTKEQKNTGKEKCLGLLGKDREKQNKGTKQYRGRDRHEVVSHAQPRYMNFAEPAWWNIWAWFQEVPPAQSKDACFIKAINPFASPSAQCQTSGILYQAVKILELLSSIVPTGHTCFFTQFFRFNQSESVSSSITQLTFPVLHMYQQATRASLLNSFALIKLRVSHL